MFEIIVVAAAKNYSLMLCGGINGSQTFHATLSSVLATPTPSTLVCWISLRKESSMEYSYVYIWCPKHLSKNKQPSQRQSSMFAVLLLTRLIKFCCKCGSIDSKVSTNDCTIGVHSLSEMSSVSAVSNETRSVVEMESKSTSFIPSCLPRLLKALAMRETVLLAPSVLILGIWTVCPVRIDPAATDLMSQVPLPATSCPPRWYGLPT
jgi:hypothetical protein